MSRQVIEERLIKLGIDNEQFKKGLKESLSSLEALDKGLSKSDVNLVLLISRNPLRTSPNL